MAKPLFCSRHPQRPQKLSPEEWLVQKAHSLLYHNSNLIVALIIAAKHPKVAFRQEKRSTFYGQAMPKSEGQAASCSIDHRDWLPVHFKS